MAADHPCLVAYVRGRRNQPLVVFVPGGSYLARVGYGYAGLRPDDFLAAWLRRAGYGLLALSYPVAHPLFPTRHPEFSVHLWAGQIAELARDVIERDSLPRRVVVLACSTAGRLVTHLPGKLAQGEIELELFVAMAATPGIPGLLPGIDFVFRPTAEGLVDRESTLPANLRALEEQEALAGRTIVPSETFAKEFLADWPVGLGGGTLRSRAPTFVSDPAADAEDTCWWDFDALPLIASISGRSETDPRHALVDRATWGFLTVQALSRSVLSPAGRAGLDSAIHGREWEELRRLVGAAPARLSASVAGGHLFFLGEPGARQVVRVVDVFRRRASAMRIRLATLACAAGVPRGSRI